DWFLQEEPHYSMESQNLRLSAAKYRYDKGRFLEAYMA
ncbi:unnamed protein product, partial [marine sediment metagenome]